MYFFSSVSSLFDSLVCSLSISPSSFLCVFLYPAVSLLKTHMTLCQSLFLDLRGSLHVFFSRFSSLSFFFYSSLRNIYKHTNTTGTPDAHTDCTLCVGISACLSFFYYSLLFAPHFFHVERLSVCASVRLCFYLPSPLFSLSIYLFQTARHPLFSTPVCP